MQAINFPNVPVRLAGGLLLLTSHVAAGGAQAQYTQITDHLQVGCMMGTPSPTADGVSLVFESNCDLTGDNADGNHEIFRTTGTVVAQLSDSVLCTNTDPSTGGQDNRVAFVSDCDLTGENADGSLEIFYLDKTSLVQLTNGLLCYSEAPELSSVNKTVFFESTCDLVGANADGNTELFKGVAGGTITQLTRDDSATGCGSFGPSYTEAGALVAFESDCDLTGENPDFVPEIFVTTPAGVVTQVTRSGDDTCVSATPAISGDDDAFASTCDFDGRNADGSLEVFRAKVSSGVVAQLSDDGYDPSCESFAPSIARDSGDVWYTSYCDPTGDNADGGFEIFSSTVASTFQVTNASACASYAPAAGAPGTWVFVSTCDLAGGNTDASVELFEVAADCYCGAPLTRFAAGSKPSATDALFVLNVAVGLDRCRLCDCDVDGSDDIAATDALATLQASVGLPAPTDCP